MSFNPLFIETTNLFLTISSTSVTIFQSSFHRDDGNISGTSFPHGNNAFNPLFIETTNLTKQDPVLTHYYSFNPLFIETTFPPPTQSLLQFCLLSILFSSRRNEKALLNEFIVKLSILFSSRQVVIHQLSYVDQRILSILFSSRLTIDDAATSPGWGSLSILFSSRRRKQFRSLGQPGVNFQSSFHRDPPYICPTEVGCNILSILFSSRLYVGDYDGADTVIFQSSFHRD